LVFFGGPKGQSAKGEQKIGGVYVGKKREGKPDDCGDAAKRCERFDLKN